MSFGLDLSCCNLHHGIILCSCSGERIGHALMGWISTAWLWLQQAWHVVCVWGHQALYYLDIAWNWVVGFVTHAYARLKGAIRRH